MKVIIKANATLWMLGAIFSLCLLAISARELSDVMHPFQMTFIRSVIGLILLSLIIHFTNKKHLFKTKKLKTHLFRHSVHFLAQYTWFIGLGILPLAQVFSLEFTTPIWTMLIASVFLKEKLSLAKFFAIIMGMLGVYIILRPDVNAFQLESIIVLIAAFCFAVAHTTTKHLATSDHVLTILFYMSLVQLPLGFILSLSHWVTPPPDSFIWLFIMGISGVTAHYCLTSALKMGDAGMVMSLDFFRLPLIGLIGVLFYAETFDVNIIFGGLLIVVGNLYVYYKSK